MSPEDLVGLTEAELVEALRAAQREYLDGQSLASVSAGGSSTSGFVQLGIVERIRAIRIRLHELNPTDYPAVSQRRVTQVVFS